MSKPDGWPVLVSMLRDASEGIQEAALQTGNDEVCFPPRSRGETQPIVLRGHVTLTEIAGLVRYLADMLEP